MSRVALLQAGVPEAKLLDLEGRLTGLNVAIDWAALWAFVQLAVSRKGQLTLDEIYAAVVAIFGLTPPQLTGVAPSINWLALLKLIADIRAGADIKTIIADIIAVIGG